MAATELLPGTVLSGSYEIVRRIGAGGMGAVYEARHRRLHDRRVAVKVLLRDLAADQEVFARFRREAEIGARLGHPHIITVTDWDALPDGSPFLVMELLVGEDLSQRMERGRMPDADIHRVLREVGSALAAAHRQGIVHRDLKPQNVFLVPVEEPDGTVLHAKVLDFGISKIAASQTVVTRESVILGTPQYMAPEQALGEASKIDERTDQFALAAIAYEMFAGRPAFQADSVTAVLFRVVYEAAPPLRSLAPSVAPHVEAAIARAMSKDRDARYPHVTDFLAALEGRAAAPVAAVSGVGETVRADGPAAALGGGGAAGRESQEKLATPSLVAAAQASGGPDAAMQREHAAVQQAGAAARPPEDAAVQRNGAAVQHARAGAHGWREGLWRFVGLALLGIVPLVAVLVWRGRSPSSGPGAVEAPLAKPAEKPAAPPTAAAPTAEAPVAAKPPAEASPVAATPPAEAPPVASKSPAEPPLAGKSPAGAHAGPTTRAPERAEPERADVAALLDDAQHLLDDGRALDAVQRAKQSLGLQKTPRAAALIFTGYCKAGDLGNARAALYLVPPSRKAALVRRCKALGLDL